MISSFHTSLYTLLNKVVLKSWEIGRYGERVIVEVAITFFSRGRLVPKVVGG